MCAGRLGCSEKVEKDISYVVPLAFLDIAAH